jgi:2-keto-4-pentenoate hydratase
MSCISMGYSMNDELAVLLASLRREPRQQSGLEGRLVPQDTAAAYRISGLVGRELGWALGGWKTGAMKEEMQRALRTSEPVYGPVYARFVHSNPASLSMRNLLGPVLEVEYVAKLGADLPARSQPYLQDEIADSVESLHPGLEIPECRFARDKHTARLA